MFEIDLTQYWELICITAACVTIVPWMFGYVFNFFLRMMVK